MVVDVHWTIMTEDGEGVEEEGEDDEAVEAAEASSKEVTESINSWNIEVSMN